MPFGVGRAVLRTLSALGGMNENVVKRVRAGGLNNDVTEPPPRARALIDKIDLFYGYFLFLRASFEKKIQSKWPEWWWRAAHRFSPVSGIGDTMHRAHQVRCLSIDNRASRPGRCLGGQAWSAPARAHVRGALTTAPTSGIWAARILGLGAGRVGAYGEPDSEHAVRSVFTCLLMPSPTQRAQACTHPETQP